MGKNSWMKTKSEQKKQLVEFSGKTIWIRKQIIMTLGSAKYFGEGDIWFYAFKFPLISIIFPMVSVQLQKEKGICLYFPFKYFYELHIFVRL